MKGQVITLNDLEMKLARSLGQYRTRNGRGGGIPNGRVSEMSDEVIDFGGAAAEIAFAKLLNIYPDLDIDPTHRPAHDAVTPAGVKVDVKHSLRSDARLFCKNYDRQPEKYASAYALFTGEPPSLRYAGMAMTEALIRAENLVALAPGRTPVYALGQEALVNFNTQGATE